MDYVNRGKRNIIRTHAPAQTDQPTQDPVVKQRPKLNEVLSKSLRKGNVQPKRDHRATSLIGERRAPRLHISMHTIETMDVIEKAVVVQAPSNRFDGSSTSSQEEAPRLESDAGSGEASILKAPQHGSVDRSSDVSEASSSSTSDPSSPHSSALAGLPHTTQSEKPSGERATNRRARFAKNRMNAAAKLPNPVKTSTEQSLKSAESQASWRRMQPSRHSVVRNQSLPQPTSSEKAQTRSFMEESGWEKESLIAQKLFNAGHGLSDDELDDLPSLSELVNQRKVGTHRLGDYDELEITYTVPDEPPQKKT